MPFMLVAVKVAGLCLLGAVLGCTSAHENSASDQSSQVLNLVISQVVEMNQLRSQVQKQTDEHRQQVAQLQGKLQEQGVLLEEQAKERQKQGALLEQQAQRMQQLETQLEALSKQTSSLGTTVNRKEATPQVAFTARYDREESVLNVGSGGTLRFPIVVTNVGSAYSPATGHFTAPYAGTYAFFATLRSTNTHGWLFLGIAKGSQVLTQFTAEGRHDHWDKGVGFATAHLRKGERVYVKHIKGEPFLEKSHLTNFSGMLLAVD